MQRQGGEQSRQTQHVVAVHVRYEYMAQATEFQAHGAHHLLRALAAINHIEGVAEVNHLRRGIVPRCGGCGAASEYVDSETCHVPGLSDVSFWICRRRGR